MSPLRAGEELVLQRDPKTALGSRHPGGGDLGLFDGGVVREDVKSGREHDERRDVAGPVEGRAQRHVGAEAVAEEVERHFRLFLADEVDEPADLVEPRAVLFDVAAPAG